MCKWCEDMHRVSTYAEAGGASDESNERIVGLEPENMPCDLRINIQTCGEHDRTFAYLHMAIDADWTENVSCKYEDDDVSLTASIPNWEVEYHFDDLFEIDYCPMCGRRLTR